MNEFKIMTKYNFLCIWPVNIEDVCISNSLFILERFWKVDKFLCLKKVDSVASCCFGRIFTDKTWNAMSNSITTFPLQLLKKCSFLFQKDIHTFFQNFCYVLLQPNPTLEINNHTPNFLNKVTILRFIFTKYY